MGTDMKHCIITWSENYMNPRNSDRVPTERVRFSV